MCAAASPELDLVAPFRHEAMLYAGDDEFVERVGGFVLDAISADEPVLVMVSGPKIRSLRATVGASDCVRYANMYEVGHNPARIIPAWRDFIMSMPADTRMRGVGEPFFATRTASERVECHVHESLLNQALAETPMWLMCPYDTNVLAQHDLDIAIANHPVVSEGGTVSAGDGSPIAWDQAPLSRRPRHAHPFVFTKETLHDLRVRVMDAAYAFGVREERIDACVLAVSEIATNCLVHGGGFGTLRSWTNERESRFVCELSDRGQIDEPLIGRIRPANAQLGGYGMWLANQLADLVQIRSGDAGSVVRLHFAR